jgi:hypothetical protein
VPRPPPTRALRHRGARCGRAPPAHPRTVQRAAHAGWLPVPYSPSVADPDPCWIRIQSGQWIKKFRVLKCFGCSLLGAEGFFCNLDVLFGGLGIGEL